MNRKLVGLTATAALLTALLLAAVALGFGHFKPARHLAITGGDPYPVAIADFNRDGRKDIAVGSESDDLVNVLFGKPGGFKPARQFSAGDYPFGISARDFNRDGRADMAVVDFEGDKIGLLRSKPGGFQGPQLFDTGPTAVDEDPVAVAAADFNRDRRPDLAVANSATGTVGILIGKPGGFKTPHTVSTGGADAYPADVTTGDFNRDGKLDVAALNYYRPNGDAGVQAAILLGRGGEQLPRSNPQRCRHRGRLRLCQGAVQSRSQARPRRLRLRWQRQALPAAGQGQRAFPRPGRLPDHRGVLRLPAGSRRLQPRRAT